jgi:zinc protease
MQEQEKRPQTTKIIVLVFCFLVIPLLLLFLAMRPAVAAPTPKHYTDLTFPALPEIKLPEYSRFQLSNGMLVYLMEDHELPLVGGTLLVRTGDRLEPAEQIGLAGMTGAVMRSGGTQTRPADEINQFLEQRAASVETGIGETSGSASFSALSEDLNIVLSLFADVVQQPAFPQSKIDLAKVQERGAIARRNDDPNNIAGREFRKLVYGETSPYARSTEYATLGNITRADLVQFYQQYYAPDQMILGIVGDFDSAKTRQLLEKTFGTWKPSAGKQVTTLPSVSQVKMGGIFFVNQPQLSQSSIQVGHIGGLISSPDYPALSVLNGVLNGFGGRLFNEVRTRQGLAYSVYGYWSPQFDYPGLFIAGGQTRSDATVAFVKSLLAEIEQIRAKPITQTELNFAKDSVLNSFIFNFQDPAQTLSRLLRYEYFGYPSDSIFRYRRGVEATTIADVQRVANQYLQPEKIVTLVVGSEQKIQPPIKTLAPDAKVTAIDVTIPPPPKS